MKMTEICLVNTWSDRFSMEGKLSLLHVNDTIHVMEYKDNERSIAVDIDLVELRSPDSTIRFTFPRGSNDKLVFKVEDDAEFSVLCKAKEDCQAICDLKLRLQSVLRDSYYSGVYSNLDPDAKINLCDEMDRLKKENPGVFFSALLNASERKPDTHGTIHKANRELNDENAIRLSEVTCVFCDSAKAILKDLDFVLHPNVSQNSANRPVFMCGVCIENWKEFRENAEHEDQLVLPGEVNEEICAVCSDTPESLVLCGECPRSFCSACLAHLLTPAQLRELEHSDDWVCVCCAVDQSRHPPLTRTAWKMVMPVAGRRGHAYCTLVPYTKKNHAKGLVYNAAALKMAVESPTVMHATPMLSKESALAIEVKKNGPGAGAGTGRGARKASYEESEVDPLASLHAATRNSDNNRGKRMEKRQRGDGGGGGNGTTGNEPDEKYYFGQYVGYYNLLCEDVAQRSLALPKPTKGKRKAADEVPTDDVCFLCKDGGDLIECDWRCPLAKNGERCLKVYHAYCLDYEVADDNWVCPRHYCDMCGSKTLKYICKYCPVSICANCPEKIVSKYGHARYCEVKDALSGAWRHTPTAPGVQSIVCHTCTEMLEVISSTAVDNIKVSSNSSAGLQGSASVDIMLADLRVQKRFPGVYEGESSGGGSVFRKDPSSTSDNISSGDSFVYSKGKALPVKNKPKAAASVTSSTLSTVAGGGHSTSNHSNNNSNSKWSYRRWSDKETAVLRAAVRVHGDDAEAIKQDPKFAEALQFRHAEAIWNKILREALIPSEKNTPEASEMEEESDDEEEGEGEGEKSADKETVVKKEKSNGKYGKGETGTNVGVVKEESSTETEDSQSSLFREKKIVVPVKERSEETSTEESCAMDVDNASEAPSVPVTISSVAPTEETEVPTEIDAAELPELAETTKSCEETTAQDDLTGGAAEEPATMEGPLATIPPVRSSSRMSADASISTTDSKRQGPGRGGRGRTRGGGGGRGGRASRNGGRSSTNSPALSNPDGAQSDGEHASDAVEEEEEDQGPEDLPQMVATRGTRRQSEEKVLSTRSGKKLFLTGSDLLPSLH